MQPHLSRRALLGALASGAAAAVLPGAVRAQQPPQPASPAPPAPSSRLREVTREALGATAWLELDAAPFPAPGAGYKDRTVAVFVPSHYRLPASGHVDLVVHFHGHSTTVAEALKNHQLREQLFDSKQNALLVVPQGPVNSSDSSCGKLEAAGGFAALLADLRRTLASRPVARALGPSAVREGSRVGSVCLSAHSGGFHAAAQCLRHGGAKVREVYLFDALYSDVEVFRDWVVAGKGKGLHDRHKLISYYGQGTTGSASHWLLQQLEKAGVVCEHETVEGQLSRERLSHAEAVFIRMATTHGGVTHDNNELRDCLFASGLTRRLRTSWFQQKSGPRVIERRR